MLARKEWDGDYIEAKSAFNKLRDAESGLAVWAKPEHKDSPQLTNIRNTLNDYELIAVGIQEGILDEALYRRWFRQSLLKDWEAAQPFIRAIQRREGSARIFCEFEWLAARWGGSAQKDLPLECDGRAASSN